MEVLKLDKGEWIMNNNFKEIGKIYETTNYDAFSFLHFNRNAKPRKDLLDALEKYGRFFEPIIVSEDLEVLDGQHRLLSAKLKETPISFYVVDDVTAKQVIKSVNTERKSWTTREYVDFYDKLGNKNYQTLNDYLHKDVTKKLSDSTVQDVLGGANGQSKKVKNGTYKTSNIKRANDLLSFMDKVANNHKGKMGVRVARIILTFSRYKEINFERLYQKLKDSEVYKQVSSINGENAGIDYLMSEYNKGLTTNYVEYYFDKRGSFQVIK